MIEVKVYLEKEHIKLLMNWNNLTEMQKEVLDDKVYGQMFNSWVNGFCEVVGNVQDL